MGGPDSQYPVENSTETAHCCGYRKGSRNRVCAHERRKVSILLVTHTQDAISFLFLLVPYSIMANG